MQEQYSKFVKRLFAKNNTGTDGVLHAALGLAGETGEVVDLLKKKWVRGEEVKERLILELGDIEFYVEASFLSYARPVIGADIQVNTLNVFDAAAQMYEMYARAADVLTSAVNTSWLGNNTGAPPFALIEFVTFLRHFEEKTGVTAEYVQARSMEKLNIRFPHGYTDTAAIAQADKVGGDA